MEPTDAVKAPVNKAKGALALAKKKPIITIGIVVGIAFAAYLIRRRQNAQNATTDAAIPSLDYQGASAPIGSSTSIPDYGGGGSGYYYPDGTQGAVSPLPGGTSGNVPLPPDSWGPPWWWVNPAGAGGGLPSTMPGEVNAPPAPQDYAPLPDVAPPAAPAYINGPPSPHVITQAPQPITPPAPSRPPWAGPGKKYPFDSDRGWYRVVLIAKGDHRGRWHYYGPNDLPKIKVSNNP